jgi:hypothetical protein
VSLSRKIKFPVFPADFPRKREKQFPGNSPGNGNGKSRKRNLSGTDMFIANGERRRKRRLRGRNEKCTSWSAYQEIAISGDFLSSTCRSSKQPTIYCCCLPETAAGDAFVVCWNGQNEIKCSSIQFEDNG